MKTMLLAVWALAAPWSAVAETPPTSGGAQLLQDAFAGVASKAKPAVVNISTVMEEKMRLPHFFFGNPEDFFGLPPGHPKPYRFRAEGTGSGFVIDPKGYVLTNEHVVKGATEIKVTRTLPNGKTVTESGRVVGHDASLDLAIVRVQTREPLPFLRFADPATVRVGDWAIAIGSPFALEQTVTAGIVSAQRQSLMIEGRRYPDMIQTDAAINRGNSGGPLLNLRGEVIGVNTAIYSPSGAFAGIGFAISAADVKPVLDELIAGRKIRRGWLGLEAAEVDEVMQRRFHLPEASGALVNSVFPDSPAAKAGLKRGDVIRRIDGKEVGDPGQLATAAAALPPGERVAVQLYRDGQQMTLEVKLGERPEWASEPGGRPQGAQPPEPEGEQEPNATLHWEGVDFGASDNGVSVLAVSPDSPLAEYLRPGDQVRGIDEVRIESLSDARRATAKAKLSQGVLFDVVRDGQPLYLSVKP